MARNARIIDASSGVAESGNAAPAIDPNITPESTSGNRSDSDGTPELIAGYETYDPGAESTESGSGTAETPRKRRGRPPGSKNGVSSGQRQKAPKNLEGIEALLLSVHTMGAMALSTPELALTPDEAKQLSDALANVSQYYPVGLSPKMMAWINLAMVAGGIYGTRVVAIIQRGKAEKASKKSEPKPIPLVSQVQTKSKPNGAAQDGPLSPSQFNPSGVEEFPLAHE